MTGGLATVVACFCVPLPVIMFMASRKVDGDERPVMPSPRSPNYPLIKEMNRAAEQVQLCAK
ncbi:hypothetical protein FT673_18130 [Aeromonas hydrophila]|nr:hypothetical protein FT673_18130 [Aeromonas hydrophila]